MKLFFREVGEGKPFIILHGLFGSSDNWLSIGKSISKNYKVFLVDQRNHGNSPRSEEFNYSVMADDLAEFIDDHQLHDPIIMGHSMGGKTAMEFAKKYPEKIQKLIVADIAPRQYPLHHQLILKGLSSVDLEGIKSRKEADEQLANYVPGVGVRQFLLKNLSRNTNGSFAWKINLQVIKREIANVGESLGKDVFFDKPTLFVRGAKSDYIRNEDELLINSIFSHYQLVTIPDAGHWLHAERPAEFLKCLNDFLS
ncbi:alpha/beta fold hydrolase [Xanthovirga aplysinae]|uniref:alpha/beta fold hydrolase n=1 Tax=Xanthovirga aplysinae TaxID=2529853 RepID=UPI0012BB49F4|nr:alpha/beta fold hydrolase [Xanthovirga aplysinae]MTI31316.1 alpha/beta fold hydrolase [Xanthovirga aplysinae]